ncbi:hypothetical protein QN277_001710 [Acacia crassicarpa]|uniref:At2g35280-like TPR domain-containing protein n=1 Tax=Acacia crassicarpa TaxID=499986 RepID=A0AAE1N995_9FABA|nr:hypothetical protein QN277_001710 [Acacia crassicarpa]
MATSSQVLKETKTTDCKNSSNCITCYLPIEIFIEIAARVSSHSLADLYHLKLTSKEIINITDDDNVYEHACLDKVPFFPDLIPKQDSFLSRCLSSGNLESLYRQGMKAFFCNSKPYEEGLDIIRMAGQKGHDRSMYAFAIIVLILKCCNNNARIGLLGVEEFEEALRFLRMLRNQKCVLKCRNDVRSFVSELSSEMQPYRLVDQAPTTHLCRRVTCKNTWRLKIGIWFWLTHDDDDENDPKMCENCRWDHELEYFCAKTLYIDVPYLLYD